nr:expressed protein [Hymenolepis microstoma]
MTQHLSGPAASIVKDASCEANFEADIFSSIINILKDGESQASDEDNLEQLQFDGIEFPNRLCDEESDILSQTSPAITPTNSKENITISELERLVEVSELRMKEYLAFLKEKDDKLKGSVATGNRSGKLVVRVPPVPMEIDENSEKSVSSSKNIKETALLKKTNEPTGN